MRAPRPARDAAPRAPSRALPGRGSPATRPEDASRRTRRSPHDVRTIRQRSRRSPPATGRPARRCGLACGASAGADPDGGHPQHVRPGPFARVRARPGRAGMGCWVRTAAGGAAVRTPSDRRGEAAPGGARRQVPGRQCVPAGAARAGGTGTLPRPADRGDAPSGRDARRWPWRTLLAAAGGLRARARVPRLRPVRPRRRSAPPRSRSPSAASGSAPGSGSAWSSGWPSSCRCCPGPASTSGPLPVAGPRRLGGRCTWRCSAGRRP